MRVLRFFVLLSVCVAGCGAAGCSLSGLDRVQLPVCSTDDDCAALAATVDDPACETFVCITATGRCAPAEVDADRDGETPEACGGTDCDDHDPALYAAATEICNGIDDDCDGDLDGPDEDDDGDHATDLCGGPAVANDCDDQDAFTFFGAPEYCDRIDNDCLIDGVARQSGGAREEPSEDRDGDGHAAIDATCLAMPDGPSARFFPLDDCDDTRATVYPGADELCDGLDNDCDGVPDDAAGSTEPGTTCVATGLVAGGDNTCLRSHEGDLVCWGTNSDGELGDLGAPADAAIIVAAAEGLTSVSFGPPGACGVTSDGGVMCWGKSYLFDRQLTTSFTSHAPARVPGVANAVEVSVGNSHACARTSAGTIICWGYSCPGPFVDGATTDCTFSMVAAEVAGIDDAVEVDAGASMTCARRASGEVWCWGFNYEQRLGTGPDHADGRPGAVIGIDDATDIGVGGFACAMRASGELWCWADDLGCTASSCPSISVARAVPLEGTPTALVMGGTHACVLYDDGTFGCWGDNADGQLAVEDMSVAGRTRPRLASATGALELALGNAHTCARFADRVRCWGRGNERQLGDGRTVHTSPPFYGLSGPRVSVTANAMQIAGGLNDLCFRLPDLTVQCNGTGTFGEIPTFSPFGIAETAFGEAPVIDIALGGYRTVVVRSDGRIHSYGDSRYAATAVTDEEGYVAGVTGAVDAACGESHCCVVRESGDAMCFGLARDGLLGDGGAATDSCSGFQVCSRTPLAVAGLEHAISIAAGSYHTCAIHEDGGVSCWGENDRGQTGSVPLGATLLATRVVGLPPGDPAVGLALSAESTCAVLASGAVWCWGASFGTSGFSVDPQPLDGGANVVQIAATRGGLCVRQRSGVVRCVGANGSGQLGDGTTTGSATLRTVLGVTDARDIGCGYDQCCATRTSGQTVCWGENGEAQLGVGDSMDRSRATSLASMIR